MHEGDLPPDQDAVGVLRFKLHKEETTAAELGTAVSEVKDAMRETEAASASDTSPLITAADLQEWAIDGGFAQISATYSELLALGRDGVVYRWPWDRGIDSPEAGGAHPCLTMPEKVCSITSSLFRTTVLTERSQVATLIDESLWSEQGLEKAATPATPAEAPAGSGATAEPAEPVRLHAIHGRNIGISDGGLKAKKTSSYNNAVRVCLEPGGAPFCAALPTAAR